MITGPLLHLRMQRQGSLGLSAPQQNTTAATLCQLCMGISGSPQKYSAHQSLAPALARRLRGCVLAVPQSGSQPPCHLAASPAQTAATGLTVKQGSCWDGMRRFLETLLPWAATAAPKTLPVPASLRGDHRNSDAALMRMIFVEMERGRAEKTVWIVLLPSRIPARGQQFC